eukprot:INCI3187.5.p1 GENE.INCI3187.5~~INCI3187.5.p1  ORF type:complete len:372 (+),score=128.21 INCI3187.5:316-1431(+)
MMLNIVDQKQKKKKKKSKKKSAPSLPTPNADIEDVKRLDKWIEAKVQQNKEAAQRRNQAANAFASRNSDSGANAEAEAARRRNEAAAAFLERNKQPEPDDAAPSGDFQETAPRGGSAKSLAETKADIKAKLSHSSSSPGTKLAALETKIAIRDSPRDGKGKRRPVISDLDETNLRPPALPYAASMDDDASGGGGGNDGEGDDDDDEGAGEFSTEEEDSDEELWDAAAVKEEDEEKATEEEMGLYMEEYEALTKEQHEIEARVQSIAKLKEAKVVLSPKGKHAAKKVVNSGSAGESTASDGPPAIPGVIVEGVDLDADAQRAIAALLADDSSDSDESVYDDDELDGSYTGDAGTSVFCLNLDGCQAGAVRCV